MPVNPVKVLALVLCLGWTVMTQEGSLLSPSISAEPGLVIPKGHSVSFVCSNPGGYDTFRLEKGGHAVMVKENTQSPMTEVRFHLGPVNESTSGGYSCLYLKWGNWSPRSETLELMVTREDVTQAPDPGSAVNSGLLCLYTSYSCKLDRAPNWGVGYRSVSDYEVETDPQKSWGIDSFQGALFTVSTLQRYKVWNAIRMTLAGVVLLVLGAILGEAWYNQQKSTDSLGSMNLGGDNQ